MSKEHWHSSTVGSDLHTWPCGDSKQHVPSDDCFCMPHIRLEKGEYGQDSWRYEHRAQDGRPGPDMQADKPGTYILTTPETVGLIAAGVLLVGVAIGRLTKRR